jgi:hypothetical protein
MQTVAVAALMPSCQMPRRAVCQMLTPTQPSPKHLYNSSSTSSRACSSFSWVMEEQLVEVRQGCS